MRSLATKALLTVLSVFSLVLGAAGPVRAQRAGAATPLAVSVESADSRVRPRAVRTAVARVLDVPIVSLLDVDADRSRGILVIVVARGGHIAQLYFQMPSGRRQLSRVTAPEGESGASWIAVAVAEFFRSPPPPAGWATASEVLDPFVPRVRSGAGRVVTEVLDPWAISARERPSPIRGFESGDALGSPRPR